MQFRNKSRLLTALLLILAAFGVPGSAFPILQLRASIVCTGGPKQRTDPRPLLVHRAVTPAPRTAPLHLALPEQRLPDTVVLRWFFQRPPPTRRVFRG